MAERIPALVNPKMLEWAREQAGYSPEEAAGHAKIPVDKLLAWEAGALKPTLSQAEGLAAFYHCAYSVFCLESPPRVTPLAAECRRLPGIAPGQESPELRFALRQMLQQRRLSLWLTEELGEEIDRFALKAHLSEDTEVVALRFREALAVSVESQKAWRDEFHAWRVWREAVERIGVLVFQFSKVPAEEVRGLSVLDFPLPVIGVNSKETPASKPFTLIHELVHLSLECARRAARPSREAVSTRMDKCRTVCGRCRRGRSVAETRIVGRSGHFAAPENRFLVYSRHRSAGASLQSHTSCHDNAAVAYWVLHPCRLQEMANAMERVP